MVMAVFPESNLKIKKWLKKYGPTIVGLKPSLIVCNTRRKAVLIATAKEPNAVHASF